MAVICRIRHAVEVYKLAKGVVFKWNGAERSGKRHQSGAGLRFLSPLSLIRLTRPEKVLHYCLLILL